MLEFAWMNVKKKTRLILSLGHGLPGRGQTPKITLIREYLSDKGHYVEHADMLWKFG